MSKIGFAGLALTLGLTHAALGAAGDAAKGAASKSPPVKGADVAKADAARKKPLQRCDELADKAQLECLQKARERIVEARQKREASAKSAGKGTKQDAPPKDAPSKTAPSKDAPSKTAPSKDAPSKTAPSKDAPSKDAPQR